MPHLKAETVADGSVAWLTNTHGINDAVTGTAKADDFTGKAVKSGTPVDYTDLQAVKPWTGDGKLGFVLFDRDVTEDTAVPVLVHGNIKTNKLPVEGFEAPEGTAFTFIEGGDK